MLTLSERSLLRGKVRMVEEAIEDLRACLNPDNALSLEETKKRGVVARTAVSDLRRYVEEELS